MVSGLPPTTKRAIHTRFPYASAPEGLKLAADGNSPVHHAKGTPSTIAPEGAIGLRPLVSIRFQVLFHSPPGVLFIFRLPYYSLSVANSI